MVSTSLEWMFSFRYVDCPQNILHDKVERKKKSVPKIVQSDKIPMMQMKLVPIAAIKRLQR